MSLPCPHCQRSIEIDAPLNAPLIHCPWCGGHLSSPFTSLGKNIAPSLASLLRKDALSAALNPHQHTSADESFDSTINTEHTVTDVAVIIADTASPQLDDGETVLLDHLTAKQTVADNRVTEAIPLSFSPRQTTPDRRSRPHAWQWVAVVTLAIALMFQALLADRAALAADARWRPLILLLCGAINCSVPAWQQPDAFTMLSRDVQPLAAIPGGLDVQATFRNDARWSQAWPVLLLSLSDADGRVIGRRAFAAAEYLGAMATATELAPGQSARIALQLHEPSPNVVAYSFDFR